MLLHDLHFWVNISARIYSSPLYIKTFIHIFFCELHHYCFELYIQTCINLFSKLIYDSEKFENMNKGTKSLQKNGVCVRKQYRVGQNQRELLYSW